LSCFGFFAIPFFDEKMFMTTGKAFLSVLAGVAAGTVIGIVLASKRGNKTIQNISKKMQALAGCA
jgi:hypothetical protein